MIPAYSVSRQKRRITFHPLLLFNKKPNAEKRKLSLRYVKPRWLKFLSKHKWLWFSGSSTWTDFDHVSWSVLCNPVVGQLMLIFLKTDWLTFFPGQLKQKISLSSHGRGLYSEKHWKTCHLLAKYSLPSSL